MINFAMFTVLKNNIDWAVGEQMMKLVMGNTDLHRKRYLFKSAYYFYGSLFCH